MLQWRLQVWPYGPDSDYSGSEMTAGSTYSGYSSSMEERDTEDGYFDTEMGETGEDVAKTRSTSPTWLSWLKRLILGSTEIRPVIF